MNTLLIFPPLAYPISPYLSVPLLVGQLQANGVNATGYDLNVDFHNEVLNKKFLDNSIERSQEYLVSLTKEYKGYNSTCKDFKKMPYDDQLFIYKKERIEQFLINNRYTMQDTVEYIDKAVKTLKSKEDFYNPKLVTKAFDIIQKGLDIVFLPYSPSSTYLALKKPFFLKKYDDIKYQCFHKEFNPFVEYFEEKINKNLFANYDLYGISIPYEIQLVPALTLSRLLKEKTNAHINLGGNLVTRTIDAFKKNPEIFEIFTDSISVGEGESSIIELANHVNGEIPIKNVSGLVYSDSDRSIQENKPCAIPAIEDRANVSFDGYDFRKYFIPEIVMPIQFSKGCYWGKCTFCDISFGKPNFSICMLDKAVEKIECIKNKYDIRHFEFIDEALPPKYQKELADKIIAKNLDIKYFGYARFENDYSEELLLKLKNSGLKMFQWGYESSSDRIMMQMNKGIDLKNRISILKKSYDAGIWNQVLAILGFPTETEDELVQTLDSYIENKEIMNSIIFHTFKLEKHSSVNKKYPDLNICEITNKEEFSPLNSYKKIHNENPPYKKKEERSNIIKEMIKKDLWIKLMAEEYIFLYVSHYSAQWLKNYEIDPVETVK